MLAMGHLGLPAAGTPPRRLPRSVLFLLFRPPRARGMALTGSVRLLSALAPRARLLKPFAPAGKPGVRPPAPAHPKPIDCGLLRLAMRDQPRVLGLPLMPLGLQRPPLGAQGGGCYDPRNCTLPLPAPDPDAPGRSPSDHRSPVFRMKPTYQQSSRPSLHECPLVYPLASPFHAEARDVFSSCGFVEREMRVQWKE